MTEYLPQWLAENAADCNAVPGGCSHPPEFSDELSRIQLCEFETERFTADERAAIAEFCERITGVPDCFDVNTMACIPEEFTIADTTNMFRSYFGLLRDWRGHLADLADDLADGVTLSTAARRYLQYELADWKTAQEEHRALVIEYLLGTDEHGSRFAEPATVYGCHIDGNVHAGVFSFHMQG